MCESEPSPCLYNQHYASLKRAPGWLMPRLKYSDVIRTGLSPYCWAVKIIRKAPTDWRLSYLSTGVPRSLTGEPTRRFEIGVSRFPCVWNPLHYQRRYAVENDCSTSPRLTQYIILRCSYVHLWKKWLQHTCVTAGPSGLRPLASWDCGFESRRWHGRLSVVSVVCCQVEITAMSSSLIQRGRTDCEASSCVIRKPQEWRCHGPGWAAVPQGGKNLINTGKPTVFGYR